MEVYSPLQSNKSSSLSKRICAIDFYIPTLLGWETQRTFLRKTATDAHKAFLDLTRTKECVITSTP